MEYSATRISLVKPAAPTTQRISIGHIYKNNGPVMTPRRKPRIQFSKGKQGSGSGKAALFKRPPKKAVLPNISAMREGPPDSQDNVFETHAVNALDNPFSDDQDAGPLDAAANDFPAALEEVSRTVLTSDGYEQFYECVLSGGLQFYQLSKKIFIANGWNHHKLEATELWYHIHASMDGDERIVVCLCPDSRRVSDCYHSRFMLEYGEEYFPDDPLIPLNHDKPTLISRYPWGEAMDEYVTWMSIPPPRDATIKNSTVVEYIGKDDGSGTWKCALDLMGACTHITIARRSLQQHIQRDMSARDTNPEPQVLARKVQSQRSTTNVAVSYFPVAPPVWASIRSDPPPHPFVAADGPPLLLPLKETSSCNCRSTRSLFNPQQARMTRKCTVYGLTGHWEAEIETQMCPFCRLARIGPDCREYGLFNWNNRVVVAHDVLNDYINAFTSSETPFAAWVTCISRRYMIRQQRFLDQKRFRDIWFAYAALMEFGEDMMCPKCGPSPSAVVWDGVSISFSRTMALSSLRPPTTIHPSSAIYAKTVRIKGTQCIIDSDLRKKIRNILNGPSLLGDEKGNSHLGQEDETESEGEVASSLRAEILAKRKESLNLRFRQIPDVCSRLQRVDTYLGDFFIRYFGVDCILIRRESPPTVYKDLMLQLAAEENAVQMVNANALPLLKAFLQNPKYETSTRLIHIPSLYNALQYELAKNGAVSPIMLGVCKWVYVRAESVRQEMILHPTLPGDPTLPIEEGDWKKTGCYYGQMKQIRHRPSYPSLKEDLKDSSSDQKAGCRKYYSTYSQKRQTGGIMVCWCTHSIAYGFHCIPIGEGRNDVFAAMYTHWEKAPEVVVYDFACALQPYCMLREPEFFQNTLFTIDDFHASDHTKCAPACFLKSYKNSDPRLLRINSSAAECGNQGLSRIRKAISYMGQERAMILTRVFLSIWNRLRISALVL